MREGVRNGRAKMNDKLVYRLRVLYKNRRQRFPNEILNHPARERVSQLSLAVQYGVSQSSMQSLLSGKTWCHVPMPKEKVHA